MSSPWRLDEGIVLEERGLLLPWLAAREVAAAIGAPERSDAGVTILRWSDRVFGGLPVHIEARFDDGTPPDRRYWFNADRLFAVWMQRSDISHERAGARAIYAATCQHLLATLPPVEEIVQNGYPVREWHLETASLHVGLTERFVETFAMSVRHASVRTWSVPG
ncbi:hypothetical protein [Phreatobacter sp.]|uniref:hypothetical protein n=1 Tax=Phreatobacter sp. TaxID=1966341 RepID=UPI003F72B690